LENPSFLKKKLFTRCKLQVFRKEEEGWIPIFMGMTKRSVGMTEGGLGMTKRNAGMT
jgi:hypothetical protein